jgi:hypothetical protein
MGSFLWVRGQTTFYGRFMGYENGVKIFREFTQEDGGAANNPAIKVN